MYVTGPFDCINATQVRLAVALGPANTLRAVFSFSMALESRRGSVSQTGDSYGYSLRGIYDPQRRELRLKPEKWEQQYDSYSMAPIEVRFDPRGRGGHGELKGTIQYAGCRGVTLRRDPALTMPATVMAFAHTSSGGASPSSSAPSPANTVSFLALTDRRLPSIRSVKGDAQCALLIRWLSRFTDEAHLGPLDHGARPLLRDEEFVPLFGQPYDMAPPKWRADLYDDVVRTCLSNSHASPVDLGKPLKTYAEQVGMFQEFLHAALVRPAAGVSPENIARTLAQGRESRAWMTATVAKAQAAPATVASVNELRQLLKPLDHDPHYFFFTQHRGLWPSEQQAFAKALRARLVALSGDIANAWLADLRRGARDLAAVQRASKEIQSYADFLAELEPTPREQVVKAAFSSFDQMLDEAMAPSFDVLRKAPASVEGAVRTSPVAVALDAQIDRLYLDKPIDYRDAPEAKLIRARFIDVQTAARARVTRVLHDERTRILGGAQTEWQAQVAAARTWNDLQAPARLLRQMVVEGDRERPYRSSLEAGLLTRAGVDLSTLTHPDLFASLFLGRFRLLTTNTIFDAASARRYALEGYVVKFSQQCQAFLPADRVEIVRIETEELVETRGNWEVSRTELRREIVRTGIHAAPEFATAYTRPRGTDQLSEIGQTLLALVKDPTNIVRTFGRMVETALEVRADAGRFLERHGCNSPITKRFAENVLRAAEGRPAVDPVLD